MAGSGRRWHGYGDGDGHGHGLLIRGATSQEHCTLLRYWYSHFAVPLLHYRCYRFAVLVSKQFCLSSKCRYIESLLI